MDKGAARKAKHEGKRAAKRKRSKAREQSMLGVRPPLVVGRAASGKRRYR